MDAESTRDITFVLRVWLGPNDDAPRARLLTTGNDEESTAAGATAIVGLVENALAEFLAQTR